jgi:hypothetical protein
MGQGDSKLDLKKHVVRLYQEPNEIDANEDSYWNQFFSLPKQIDDVFALIFARFEMND